VRLAREREKAGLPGGWDDPHIRDRLVRLWSEEQIRGWTNDRIRAGLRAGLPPGPESSIGKVHGSDLNQRIQKLAAEMLGTSGTAWDGATGTYSDATTKDLSAPGTATPAAWTSAAPAIATISNTGVADAVAAGTTTISAASGTISGSTNLAVTQATASQPSVQALRTACSSIKGQTVAGVMVTDATRVEPSATVPTGLCVVLGTRAPFLDIEVDIPDNWSGRILHQGGGGFDGSIPSAISKAADGGVTGVDVAVTQKAAIYAASNGGNRRAVPAEAAPAVWGSGTAEGQASGDDYSYRALGTTIGFAKSLAQMFYSAAPKWTYFNGCSEGGREAYKVAEGWPHDYDGIVQGCETMDMTALVSGLLNVSSKGGTPADCSDDASSHP